MKRPMRLMGCVAGGGVSWRWLMMLPVLLLSSVALADDEAVAAVAADAVVSEAAHEVQVNLDFVWIIAASALVFLMQAGFMCLESGMSRAKNSTNVAIKNMADLLIAVVAFWAVSFGLMFGVSQSGWFGTTDFFVDVGDHPWFAAFFVFQAMFCGTAATIDSGVVAERTRFGGYCVLSLLISALIYPVFGHWAWGSFLHGGEPGWLEGMGFIDFAGSTVVNSIGAWVGLAGAIVIGARIGRFNEKGEPRKIPAHSLVMVYLGTFILFFGWFGFNCGSTLAANTDIAGIAKNTALAACFGGCASGAMSWVLSKNHLPKAEMIANVLLGGLVGITAGCAVVDAPGAAIIGIGSGIMVYFGVWFIENVLRLDDVVSAIPVHGMCGAFGTIMLAVVMPSDLLGDVSRWGQIGVQAFGVVVAFAWAFGLAFVTFKVLNAITPLRVTEEDERIGLNVAEHGASSSLLDQANAMHRATSEEELDESFKVVVEHGTEIGDLSQHFNAMVDAVREQRRRASDADGRRVADMERFRGYMAETVASIEEQTEQMSGILGTTSGHADQLNRNAVSVSDELHKLTEALHEAARSGDAGRGFAVVADAVRQLAIQSESSVSNIAEMIGSVREVSGEAAEAMGRVATTIADANSGSKSVASAIETEASHVVQVETSAKEAVTAATELREQLG
ncbi:ammonium transporter [Mucisphaera calidilacus]|uniref:Ammonium transporter n=1 Tax=Mucisphaera calidilacus TaxID=2527982 RepID=A0A518C069_9BACT|nr:ammonium transporter [Mucisphaera calidilacus]QDU72613.1 Ammonia channel precursor [Mucisphaera calidilacus]